MILKVSPELEGFKGRKILWYQSDTDVGKLCCKSIQVSYYVSINVEFMN